jgi:glycosyltransferase involved in cell wall biosynthesis
MPIISIDTSPLTGGHAIRGIGTYTRLLVDELKKIPDIAIQLSGDGKPAAKPDIVHYPFFDFFTASLPIMRRSKTVVTIHDVIPLLFPEYYPIGKRGSLALLRQKFALKTVNAIITDSSVSKADIIKHLGVAEQRITVVPLAGNPALEPAEPSTIRAVKKRFELAKNYILYVGDINYNKNIPQLIKALKLLPPKTQLVLVGKNFYPHDIPEWRWIEAQIALSDVTAQVRMLPEIASDDTETLSALYSGALCYVQPSLYEGFGLPILEAMQCNTVTVASNRASLPEVSGGAAQLCEPTAEAFANTISEILDWSITKREQVLREQRKWLKHFSWQQTAEQTAQIYRQVTTNN